LVTTLSGLPAAPAAAQSFATRDRGVTATLTLLAQRDSNLFRLPDSTLPSDFGLSGNGRDDTTLSPGISFEAWYPYARQDFYARIAFYWNRFTQFDDYNTNSLNYRLGWTWRTAEELDGELIAARDQSNSSFQEFLGPTRNVLTLYTERAAVNWHPRPDRRFSASIDYLTGLNSTQVRSLNNFKVANLSLRATAITPLGNELYASYIGTSGDYPNRLISEVFAIDNSYWQGSFNLGLKWSPRPDVAVDARGGYVSRKYDSITARNFARPVWLFDAAWAPTAKTSLALRYVRDLSSIEDLDRAYTISTTATASVRYQFSPIVAVTAQYFRQYVNWAGDPLTFASGFLQLAGPARADRYSTPRLQLDWNFAPRWSFSAAQEWPSRTSNRNGLQYDASVTTIVLQYVVGP
jgi:hypothetical protein